MSQHNPGLDCNDDDKHVHHVTPFPIYYKIWSALILLTVITVGTSYINFGGHWNIIIAMMIATAKVLLVTNFFMGLKYDSGENNWSFYGAFIFLGIFIVLTSSDVFYRTWPTTAAEVDKDAISVIQTVDFKMLVKPTPDLLGKGATIYSQQCATCHGTNGQGDGPAAAGLNPKPRDFTAPNNWKNEKTIAGVFKTVSEGLSGTPMPSYASLTAADRMSLAHFVRSKMATPPAQTEADLQALEATLNITSGGKPAGKQKLPIEFMIERLGNPDR